MRETFQRLKRIFHCNGIRLFAFEIVFRLTMLMILYPIGSALFQNAMRSMGFSNITNLNIFPFLSNPRTILSGLFLLILSLAFFLVEVSSLFIGLEYSRHYQKIRISEMLICGTKKIRDLLRKKKVSVFVWAFLLMPFLYFPSFLLLVCSHPLIQYILSLILAKEYGIFLLACSILFISLFSVFGIFLLPHFLMEENATRTTAIRLVKKHFFRIHAYLLLSNLLLILIMVLFFDIIMAAGICYTRFFLDSEIRVSFLLGFKDRLISLTLIFSLILGGLHNLSCLNILFTHFREQDLGRFALYDQFRNDKERLARSFVRFVSGGLALLLVLELTVFFTGITKDIYTLGGDFVQTSVTAHRGGDSHLHPENTIAALEESIASMTEYAEIDVQETADGVVVLMHDTNLFRTTGINENVYDLPYSSIMSLYAEKYQGDSYEKDYVPTLASVLELCSGKIKLNIDIKSNVHYHDSIVEKVVGLIETYSSPNQCIISSTNYHYLEQVKELNPEIATGYIIKVAYGALTGMNAIDFASVKYSCVTDELVNSAHKNGLEIHVWTVNSRNAINRMKALGVDNIITDRPALTKELLAMDGSSFSILELLNPFFNQ